MWSLVALVSVAAVVSAQTPGCSIDVSELPVPQPVVLNAYTHYPLYPKYDYGVESRNVVVAPGEQLLIACPGGHLGLPGGPPSIYAQCNNKNQWIVNNEITNLQEVRCDNLRPETTLHTKVACAPNSELIEIGVNVTGVLKQFIPIDRICFDFKLRNPVYTVFNLTKSIGLKTDWENNYITDNSYYNLSRPLSQIYADVNQTRAMINSQLGLPADSHKYVNESGVEQVYLILPDEMFYTLEQNTAAHDINTYPLWPGNCYNFDQTYDDLFEYVKGVQIDLEVYTGTYGIATLPHETTKQPVELYMYNDNIKALPIPALTWRLLYHRQTQRALVLGSVDNSEFLNIPAYTNCPDISSSIPWLALNYCGHTFACSYYSFKDMVPIVPDLPVRDILT